MAQEEKLKEQTNPSPTFKSPPPTTKELADLAIANLGLMGLETFQQVATQLKKNATF